MTRDLNRLDLRADFFAGSAAARGASPVASCRLQDVDYTAAIQSAIWDRVCRQPRLPIVLDRFQATLEAVWHPDHGRPTIGAVKVILSEDDRIVHDTHLPLNVLDGAVELAASRLVAQGKLGATTVCHYRISADPRPGPSPAPHGAAATGMRVELVPQPLAVRHGSVSDLLQRSQRACDRSEQINGSSETVTSCRQPVKRPAPPITARVGPEEEMPMLDERTKRKFERLLKMGDEAPSENERAALLRELRSRSPDWSEYVDGQIIKRLGHLNQGLHEASRQLELLRAEHERLQTPSGAVAVFRQQLPGTRQAVVWSHGVSRVVTFVNEEDAKLVRRGDEVLLNSEQNLIVGRAPWGVCPVGETAEFLRRVDGERIALRWRDEELIVAVSQQLADVTLDEGDLLRWNRDNLIALEKVDRTVTRRDFINEVPDVSPTAVGGQRAAMEAIKAALLTILVEPDKAARYGLQHRQSLLLDGPPGCGKTLMARVAAAEIQRITGKKCFFATVKPGSWEGPFVGQTGDNIRTSFASFRAVADEGHFCVVFLDEVEVCSRARGHAMGYHGDKHTAALLAELDGFQDRGGVAVVSATNRKDLIDPALLERLSDVEVFVPRPDWEAAREIFRIHLAADLPFSPNGSLSATTRDEMIDRALSRLYAPNGDNELSRIQFRDGSRKTVAASEMMSGRVIAQICRNVCRRAFVRDVELGETGIRITDMEEAVADALRRLSTTLTVHNARAYLTGLPQDNDVVSVEPVTRRVERSHRMLSQDFPSLAAEGV